MCSVATIRWLWGRVCLAEYSIAVKGITPEICPVDCTTSCKFSWSHHWSVSRLLLETIERDSFANRYVACCYKFVIRVCQLRIWHPAKSSNCYMVLLVVTVSAKKVRVPVVFQYKSIPNNIPSSIVQFHKPTVTAIHSSAQCSFESSTAKVISQLFAAGTMYSI